MATTVHPGWKEDLWGFNMDNHHTPEDMAPSAKAEMKQMTVFQDGGMVIAKHKHGDKITIPLAQWTDLLLHMKTGDAALRLKRALLKSMKDKKWKKVEKVRAKKQGSSPSKAEDRSYVEGEMPECPQRFESKLLTPMSKFIVVNSRHNSFPTGTTGYVSYIRGIDASDNIATYTTVILRRGRTGKDRIDSNNIVAPIFHSDDHKIGQNRNGLDYFVIVKDITKCENILQYGELEFLGWAHAATMYMRTICQSPVMNPWPKNNTDLLNTVGLYRNQFQEYGEEVLDKVTEDFKHKVMARVIEFKTLLTKKEIELAKVYASYNVRAITSTWNLVHDDGYSLVTEACMKSTYDYYDDIHKGMMG